MPRMSVRPSKAGSAMGVLVSVIMLVVFVAVFIPMAFQASEQFPTSTPGVNQGGIGAFGVFAVFFVLVVLAVGGFYAYNLLGGRGAGFYDVDVDPTAGEIGQTAGGSARPGEAAGPNDFEAKLRKLEKLRADGLVSEDEYAAKRAEIMGQQW